MSGPFEQDFNYTPTEEFKQQFGAFDGAPDNAHPQVSGPPTPFDGVGFWYRPEPQDVYYHHHTATTAQPSSVTSEQNSTVKHRRTRSGCFTCRSRRVKCDETRPICDRCRKGNRECVFPQTSSASKRMKEDAAGEQGSTSPQDTRRASGAALDPIQDVSDTEEASASSQYALSKVISGSSHAESKTRKQKHRQQASGSHKGRSPTPSDAGSLPSRDQSSPERTKVPPKDKFAARWSKLTSAEQDLIQFQHDCMTNYHYFLRLDRTDFVHDTLISIALTFEPLLNAVLAFAAYHQQMRSAHGDFKQFWKYYCRSIVLLRKWLEDQGDRNEAVILTILQLATFEEYLGDWANLLSHHRAAHSVLVTIHNHDTVMSTETSRIIFDWFTRLDIIASLMANIETIMDRQWFITALSWTRARYDPENIDTEKALDYFHANLRLIGFDMACTFAGQSLTGTFQEDANMISERLEDVRIEIQKVHDSADSLDTLSRRQSRDQDGSPEAFDSHVPLFTNDLWPLNFIWLDWYGGQQMRLYQTAKILHGQGGPSTPLASGLPPSELTSDLSEQLNQLGLVQGQIYEAVERWSSAPAGAVLGCHIVMAFSTIFLRRDPQLIMWARRKLANVERMGYIWPATFRRSMAQLWGDEDIVHWWLPNDEGKPALVDEIRTVVEDRLRENAEKGIDDGKDGLRELKALFDNLGLGIPTSLKGGGNSGGGGGTVPAIGKATGTAAAAGGISVGTGASGSGSSGAFPTFGVSDVESANSRESPSVADHEI